MTTDPDRLEWDILVHEGHTLRSTGDGVQWALGDLAARVETTYGERTLARFADDIGVHPDTLDDYRRVARRFPIRTDNLPWWGYRVLSQFDEAVRDAALDRAIAEHWTVAKARAELKASQASTETESPERERQGTKKNLGMKASSDPIVTRFRNIEAAFESLKADEEKEGADVEDKARTLNAERRSAVEDAIGEATAFVDRWMRVLEIDPSTLSHDDWAAS